VTPDGSVRSRPAVGDWTVLAVRYATRDGVRGEHFHRFDARAMEPHPTAYWFWVLQAPGRTVLVDAGMSDERAAAMDGLRFEGTVLDLLPAIGVDPASVELVILTHLHYDHAGGVGMLPGARLVVQAAERDYWIGGDAARVRDEQWLTEQSLLDGLGDRLEIVTGDVDLAPGLQVALVGGHTRGMQVVRAATADGPVVLASDASHFYENVEGDRAGGIFDRYADVFHAFDRIHSLANGGIVVPGHDPAVAERHPVVQEHPLVVRLG